MSPDDPVRQGTELNPPTPALTHIKTHARTHTHTQTYTHARARAAHVSIETRVYLYDTTKPHITLNQPRLGEGGRSSLGYLSPLT